MPGHRSCGALLAVVLAYAGGCSGGGGGPGGGGGGGGGATATPDPVDSSPLTSTGTIAYVKGGDLHLVEPDGSNDQVIWSTPPVQGAAYTVSGPSWRPDGTEIAFASDHELALSPNATDIYAIRPDGKALRKLTNGPTRARQLTFSKGAVTVTVSNGTFYSGPYWIILLGADVKMEPSFPPGSTKTYTFSDVADLGDTRQPVVVASGRKRFLGTASADGKPGQTVDAGSLVFGDGELLGAQNPFWRSDASRVGYSSPLCILESTAAVPPPGWSYEPLVPSQAFFGTCRAEWGPASAASELLLVDSSRGDGLVDVLVVPEHATTKPAPVASFPGFYTPDAHWVQDGSGFYIVSRAALVEPMQIFQYTFATGQATQFSYASIGYDTIRRFSVSPDGQRIAFERSDDESEITATRTDVWVMDWDGSNLRLVGAGGHHPAWNPTRP